MRASDSPAELMKSLFTAFVEGATNHVIAQGWSDVVFTYIMQMANSAQSRRAAP